MGLSPQSVVLFDAVASAKRFVDILIFVYIILIFIYVLSSWVRLPYSPWLRRIQDFLLAGDPDESGRRDLQQRLT